MGSTFMSVMVPPGPPRVSLLYISELIATVLQKGVQYLNTVGFLVYV